MKKINQEHSHLDYKVAEKIWRNVERVVKTSKNSIHEKLAYMKNYQYHGSYMHGFYNLGNINENDIKHYMQKIYR